MSEYKILTVNPGSTSTKLSLFINGEAVFSRNIQHDASELSNFSTLRQELPYRERKIQQILREEKVNLEGMSACVGRGGGLLAMDGGTYRIDDLMVEHSINSANGVIHPANLGVSLARSLADTCHCEAFVVNPPDVDELWDLARMTGIKDVYRVIHVHALNQKEVAIRHARRIGKPYQECRFIVAHIGGGTSVAAHLNGKMVDGFDNVGGEGPMAPTRCGAVSVADIMSYMKGKDEKEVLKLCMKNGGFVSHLGISDAREVAERAKSGDRYADLLWKTMIYQISKSIGTMAAVLQGQVDGILLSGGLVYNEEVVDRITSDCSFIAPVTAYPGEFEMEAMAAGAIRALRGEEKILTYSGKKRFTGFKFEREEKEA